MCTQICKYVNTFVNMYILWIFMVLILTSHQWQIQWISQLAFCLSARDFFQNFCYIRLFLSSDIHVNVHNLQIAVHPTDLKKDGEHLANSTFSKKRQNSVGKQSSRIELLPLNPPAKSQAELSCQWLCCTIFL